MKKLPPMKERIVFRESNCPSIFFPVGKIEDGGSCAYCTDKCMENCPSEMLVTKEEIRVMKYFYDNEIDIIAKRIHLEVIEYFQENGVGWFSWGDCPPDLTEKIYKIVSKINELGIAQEGFTRNRKLWEIIPIKNNLRFSLSVDNLEEAKKLSMLKTICYPNIADGQANVYYKGILRARCSGYFCQWTSDNDYRECDCIECFDQQNGCYSND